MADISQVEIGSTTYDIKDSTARNVIPYIVGKQTAATGSWTGDAPFATLTTGQAIRYKLPYAGNGNASLNLTLSDGTTTGAKAVYGVTGNTRITTHYAAGSVIDMTYDGTYWRCTPGYDSNTVPSAHCTTAAATAAKTATCTYFALHTNEYVYITTRYSNTAKSALTMNINSTGAKPIYINGSASSSSNYTLPAGSYLAFYDGSKYLLRTDGKLTADITGDAATVGGFTVSTNVPATVVKDVTVTGQTFGAETLIGSISINGGAATSLYTPTVWYTPTVTSGTKIGTFNVGDSWTDIYAPSGSSSGAVDSVNGQIGAVVLKGNQINDNGQYYEITGQIRTTLNGVQGLAIGYNDGVSTDPQIFIPDGVGVSTVAQQIIGQIPTNVSSLTNDAGYLTAETDPTVPSWAKASSKPTYTASEVGALSSSTTYVSSVNGSSGAITGIQTTGNLVTSVSSASTDAEYPSAKLLYDITRKSVVQATGSTTSVSLSSGTITQIPLTTYIASDETHATWNDTRKGIEILTEGYYKVQGSVYFSALGANISQMGAYIKVASNGGAYSAATEILGGYHATAKSASLSYIGVTPIKLVYLNAHDIVYLCGRVYGATGTAQPNNAATFLLVEQA